MASEGQVPTELRDVARRVAREKIMDELREPLSELEEKRAELKRLREKVDELKEVTDELKQHR
jgi:polyhydroxyalkanoate synthesis regulator phasin